MPFGYIIVIKEGAIGLGRNLNARQHKPRPKGGDQAMFKHPALMTLLVIVSAATVTTSCALFRIAPRGPAPPTVFELQYKSLEEMRFQSIGMSYVRMSLKPRETLVAEPIYFSKRPLYGEIQLGDSEDKSYAVVIDESKGTRSGYDTMYVDGNNNEDMTDDVKLVGKIIDAGSLIQTQFPPVEVPVAYGGKNYPYNLRPLVNAYSEEIAVQCRASGYCEGELRFGDKKYKVALFDDTSNGLFNDKYETPRGYTRDGPIYAQGDTLAMDMNGDGAFEKKYQDTPEMYHVGKYVSFGDKSYQLEIAPNGRTITVRETETPCGYVTSEQKGASIELISNDGALKVNGGGSKSKVPVGEYRLAACSFDGKDDKGAAWRIAGRGLWGQTAIQVSPGENTTVKFGPPLKATVAVGKRGDSFSFGLDITGQGGETYSARDFERNGGMIEAPRLEIRNEKGEVVARANFEYG